MLLVLITVIQDRQLTEGPKTIFSKTWVAKIWVAKDYVRLNLVNPISFWCAINLRWLRKPLTNDLLCFMWIILLYTDYLMLCRQPTISQDCVVSKSALLKRACYALCVVLFNYKRCYWTSRYSAEFMKTWQWPCYRNNPDSLSHSFPCTIA